MQRATATVLIALVALMALLPQAMCPCSLRARAEATSSAPATAEPAAPCCERCLARLRQEQAEPAASLPCQDPSAPAPCPCCGLNGNGKQLVLRGEAIEPAAPAVAEFVALSTSVPTSGGVDAPAAVRAAAPGFHASPPADLRAGVVLRI